jgi:hypothetical protein
MIIRNAAALEAIGKTCPLEKAGKWFIHALSEVRAGAGN